MLRRIIAVLCGLIVATIDIFFIQYISHILYPLPEGFDFENIEAAKAFISNMPIGAFLFILLAYASGSFIGGFVSALIVKEKKIPTALIMATILFILGLMNLIMIPHPVWFAIATCLVYHPFAFFGGVLALRSRK